MSGLALGLVLAAAIIHASWNLLAKKSGGDVRFVLLTACAIAVLWAPVGLVVSAREWQGYGWTHWGLIAASGALHVLYYVSLLRGYRLGDLTVVYPLARGTGPLLTASMATTLLGEHLGALGWAGVAGVVVGIVLIAGGPATIQALMAARHHPAADQPQHDQAVLAHQRLRAGMFYGAVTGMFIAAYTVVDGYAVRYVGMSPIAIDYLGNLARIPCALALVLWVARQQGGSLRQYMNGQSSTGAAAASPAWRALVKPAAIIALVSPISYVMVLFAAQLAPLSQVAPAREVSMLFAALLGGALLGEQQRGWRVAGAASMAVGVMLLAGVGR